MNLELSEEELLLPEGVLLEEVVPILSELRLLMTMIPPGMIQMMVPIMLMINQLLLLANQNMNQNLLLKF